MLNFVSDNAATCHPKVLDSLLELNHGHQTAYGVDEVSDRAKALFKQHFGDDIAVFFTQTGTASNVLSLKSVVRSFEAVLCADSSHLYRDECGAPEALLGSKLIPVKTVQGKVTVENLDAIYHGYNIVHRVQPRVLSISQVTEWGTVYSIDEVKNLSLWCHERGLLLHMDGARLHNACAYLDRCLKSVSVDCGVDILSLGGTKNGLINAEAVIFFDKDLAKNTPFWQKQLMQLTSKMRFIAAQWISLLEQNLWIENARQANPYAALLSQQIADAVDIVMPVQSNVLFIKLHDEAYQHLKKVANFVLWQESPCIARIMTAFDTVEDDIIHFAEHIKQWESHD